jgi:tRNA (cmo5U34)-methyltransferase
MTDLSGPSTSLGHLPAKEKWEFDASVAECFEDMLRRSIPQHDEMRDLVFDLARRFLREGSTVVDLGASRGDAIASLATLSEPKDLKFVAVECAPAMLAILRERFKSKPRVTVLDHDLRAPGLRAERGRVRYRYREVADVILSVLTLQFTPIEHRLRIVREAHESLKPGGALIVVEKVLGETAAIDEALVSEYHAFKRQNGYSQEEVDRKKASLEGVLVPVTARWNVELLKGAGFRDVDCFWRALNFAGFLAVKS